MTKQFLQEYVEASPSECKLKEALVDKTEAEILRAYELQCFYDTVEKRPFRMKSVEIGFSSSESSSAQQMHITYEIDDFKPMTIISATGSFIRPNLLYSKQEQYIDLFLHEYYKNQKLLDIFINWLLYARQIPVNMDNKKLLNSPILAILDFTQEEIEIAYEKTKRI